MRTHIDLFSGIGGFALACRWAGVETIGFAEIDDYASRVLAKNFPGVVNYGDIRNVPPADNVWLITGGFPCQPFSVAGKHRGADDDRWLWPEMAACVERIRPDWVLAENVPGIVNMELDTVLSDLEAIDYTAWAVVVPAVAVDAPHRRDRVWIVACADAYSGDGGTEQKCEHDRPKESDGGSTARMGLGIVAHADRDNGHGRGGNVQVGRQLEPGTVAPDGDAAGVERQPEPRLGRVVDGLPTGMDGAARWEPEPDIPRIASGVADRVNRLKGLGNAIVPQVAYQLIRMMIEAEAQQTEDGGVR